jgi:hypothetical protein
VESGVELYVYPGAPAGDLGRAGDALEVGGARGGDVDPPRERGRQEPGLEQPGEDRRLQVSLSQDHGLLDPGHAQPARARRQGRPGDRNGAVAESVGLDDRHERRPASGFRQHADVRRDRVEVDARRGERTEIGGRRTNTRIELRLGLGDSG